MAKNILIYDVVRTEKLKYKSHYRMYNTDRILLAEGDYVYTIRTPRRMPPACLKSKIVTGIIQRLKSEKVFKNGDIYTSECLVSRDVLLKEMEDFIKPTPSKVIKSFEKKVVVEDNPRIYSLELINGHYTIVKVEKQYLTREQAKEELFNKQIGGL